MTSISEAIALLGKGRANPSCYQVLLPQKATGLTRGREVNDYIRYFCRSTTLPTSSNSVQAIMGHERVGINRHVISGRGFGSPVVMTFTDRSDLIIYNTLKNWIDSTVIGSQQVGGIAEQNLRSAYYGDIVSEIQIIKLEPKRTDVGGQEISAANLLPTGIWTLHRAIPISIEQTTLAIEAADTVLDFTCAIAYESFSFTPLVADDLVGTAVNTANFVSNLAF